jgi:O-antigen/teichoic acid export membrane protein
VRIKNSIHNIIIIVINYLVITIIGLFIRKAFLSSLGIEYVGLDEVFANILSFLSLVELGIGPAITYRLYKPLAENDYKEITILLLIYKKFYKIVAIVITLIGIILSFFIPIIIKNTSLDSTYIVLCYLLFMASSVASYGFAHKRSLLLADQKEYVAVKVDIIFNITVFVIKLIALYYTKNYMLILIINIFRVISSNFIVAYLCNQRYPYIKDISFISKKDFLDKAKDMTIDIKYILLHKIAGYIYSSTDAIVISSYMSVVSVGLLSSYKMIAAVISNLFMQCSSAIQSSIGNLIHKEKDKSLVILNLKKLSYIYFTILNFMVTSFLCLIDPFITIWLGKEYLLHFNIVILICINMYIYSFHQPIANIYTVTGLFKQDKITAPFAAIVNIIVSVLMVKQFGLVGVYIGTILGSLIYVVGRTYLVYKYYFERSPLPYVIDMIKYLIVAMLCSGSTYFFINLFLRDNSIELFLIKMVLCLLFPNVVNIVLYHNSDEFNYFSSFIKRFLKPVK